MLNQLLNLLRSPGTRPELQFTAPSYLVECRDPTAAAVQNEKTQDCHIPTDTDDAYLTPAKPRRLDRWLDRLVALSGSEYVYATILLALLAWAFLGIPFGNSASYKIIISDAQAIVNLVFDAFLMRQQFNQHDTLLMVAGCLRSRTRSHKHMLASLVASNRLPQTNTAHFHALSCTAAADGQQASLPRESTFTKLSTTLSAILGHMATALAFWACVLVWLGFGPYCGWSVTWQLYLNSATSALMVLLLAFLANVRERHSRYAGSCLSAIWRADAALERRLRAFTGDAGAHPAVVVAGRRRSSAVQRAIDYYADFVGTLAGVALLVVVVAAWVACGPALRFGSGWWLLMGTYAGLVGLNDGFVLRNICQVLGDSEDEQFELLDGEDRDTLAVIGVEALPEERVTACSFSYRLSVRVGWLCSHEWTVVLGVFFIVGLLVGASVMRWDETGQLLCNIPPSVVESFFTLILITGHNVGEKKRTVDLVNVHLRRLKLLAFVERQSGGSEGPGE
jgi:low-affinity ferrous iron transport protein